MFEVNALEIIHYCRALSFCSVTRLSKTDQSACWAIYRSFWALSNQFRLAAWFRLLALLPKEPFTLITGRHCVAFILTYSFGWAGVKSLRTSSPCDRGNLGEYAQSILSLITEYAFDISFYCNDSRSKVSDADSGCAGRATGARSVQTAALNRPCELYVFDW